MAATRTNKKKKTKARARVRAAPIRKKKQPAPARPRSYPGACHCGAIEYTFETTEPMKRWEVHLCQCEFCRGHGARTVSDPGGEVRFDFTRPELLRRYRFGLRTADFLICKECGTYVGAVMLSGHGASATINVNTLRPLPAGLPRGHAVSWQGEAPEDRRARRVRSWTPVSGPV